jgi:hypothetical protein
MVPCVVDARGPDPVPEHDSDGEFIHAVATYYRFTGDRVFLEKHWPNVVSAAGHIESLRAQRMTDEFRLGAAEKRVLLGLLPESISHEGYSAKPMHSYWDDFWALLGLKDAADMAEILGNQADGTKYATLRDEFRGTLYDSIRMAASRSGIGYVPGCAELGDFDATSTAVAVHPAGELGFAPDALLRETFEKYERFFRDRASGNVAWRDYTPYELRLVGVFLRLGMPGRAQALLDFFMQGQRPRGWRQWAEIVWFDSAAPRFIGDVPHTWVGAEFINSVRAMFVHEAGDSLVIAAGVKAEWLEDGGVRLERFPTWFGELSYSLWTEDGNLHLELVQEEPRAFRGFTFVPPGERRIESIDIAGQPVPVPTDRVIRIPPTSTKVVVRFSR